MTSSGDEEAFVTCGTTKGDIKLHLIREWSPNGYDRAVELYERHFYDNSHFFRAVPNFLVQFGISYSKDKELQAFSKKHIQDDPKHDPPIEFHPGTISYAGSGPNSRTSQMFFSYGSSKSLGRELWETPIGKVIEGMENAKDFYSYGDMPPWGKGPVQGKIYNGPQYIEENFPLIDKFLECTVERIKPSKDDADDGDGGEIDGEAGEETDDGDGNSTDYGDGNASIDRDDGVGDAAVSTDDDENEGKVEKVEMKMGEAMWPKPGQRRLGSKTTFEINSQVYIAAGVMVVALILFFLSLRRRRKEVGKMN